MKNILHLAFSYMKYYKKQTLSLLLGVILSAGLLTGMGSLLKSGREAGLEKARVEYGDWHYYMPGDENWVEKTKENTKGDGYEVKQFGVEKVRKEINESYRILLVYADQGYLEMMKRECIKGHYPQKENEVAMDAFTLRNLDIPQELGSEVVLDGETFVLSGIFSEMPKNLSQIQGDFMQVFVDESLDYGQNQNFLYARFNEDQVLYKQIEAFRVQSEYAFEDLPENRGIGSYIDLWAPESALETIKMGIQEPRVYGLPYIWGTLNETGILTERTILVMLGFFGVFIIYSLFQISVMKRIAGYSVMQTVGMTDTSTFGVLLTELSVIFVIGYPIGAVLGNGTANLLYRKIGKIFIAQDQTFHTGVGNTKQLEQMALNLTNAGNFYINWSVIFMGAMFLLVLLALISWMLVGRMKKLTIRQMIAKDTGKGRVIRRSYSLRHSNMAGILTKKFMFYRKGTFLGILLSLAVGSIVFLGAAYVTENTKINNELTFKADDGLGSDIQIYEESDQIIDVIPLDVVEQLRQAAGLESVNAVRYLLGEVPLQDGTLIWTEYFAEIDPTRDPDPELMKKYNGVINQTGEDDYSMRVNIYGYDDEMLKEMESYLLDGTIDPDLMRKDNSVVFKTVMDGQGNYDAFNIHPGDMLPIKTIKDNTVPQEALRFLGEEQWYQNKTMKVAAIASRPLAVVDSFIGDTHDNCVDLIMTNEQMERNFGVSDYRMISISLKEDADADSVAGELRSMVSGILKSVVKDYTPQIEAQNLYLTQKMLFFYGTAAIFFGISILHIMNSMQYLVAIRKHEFGIIRAMGITDWGFCKMMAAEGFRYGIYSSLSIGILFFFVQKILHYFMVHVYLYLHPKPMISWIPVVGVIITNLVICIGVILFSGRSILKNQIVDEIRE